MVSIQADFTKPRPLTRFPKSIQFSLVNFPEYPSQLWHKCQTHISQSIYNTYFYKCTLCFTYLWFTYLCFTYLCFTYICITDTHFTDLCLSYLSFTDICFAHTYALLTLLCLPRLANRRSHHYSIMPVIYIYIYNVFAIVRVRGIFLSYFVSSLNRL